MIKHEGGKWILYTKDGSKKLGTHDTEAEAVAQERAIEAYKHRNAGDAAGHEFHGNQYAGVAAAHEQAAKFHDKAALAYSQGDHEEANDLGGRAHTYSKEAYSKTPDSSSGHVNAEKNASRAVKIAKTAARSSADVSPTEKINHHMEAAKIHREIARSFRASSEAPRFLHVSHALGQVQTIEWEGREHLVVPIVALMEGVIHAVNAANPEYVDEKVLAKAASTWNGKPIVLGHPVVGGKHVSADDPDVRAAYQFGIIRESKMNGKRLGMEGLVDPKRLEELKQTKLLADIRAGKSIEVSVGANVAVNKKESEYRGKKYKAEWLEVYGDHLAFLPNGVGACSLEMGCGSHRAATHFVTCRAFETTLSLSTLAEQSLDERIQAVNSAVQQKWGGTPSSNSVVPAYVYAQVVYDDHAIIRKDDKMWSVDYTVGKDGEIELGDKLTEVKMAYVAAEQARALSLQNPAGSKIIDLSFLKDLKEHTHTEKWHRCWEKVQAQGLDESSAAAICTASIGDDSFVAAQGYKIVVVGEPRAAAGARHSSSDMKMIQQVHDHSVALGATCDRGNL